MYLEAGRTESEQIFGDGQILSRSGYEFAAERRSAGMGIVWDTLGERRVHAPFRH